MIYLSFNIPPVRKYYVYYTNTVNESMFSPQNESTVQENILQRKTSENYPYVSMKNIFLKQSDGWASTVATIFFHILFCDFLDCISDIG